MTHTAEQIIVAATRIVMRAALRLIESNPHQWSHVPCQTCAGVTAMLGEPFGCVALDRAAPCAHCGYGDGNHEPTCPTLELQGA
jgi:hypothetical protein